MGNGFTDTERRPPTNEEDKGFMITKQTWLLQLATLETNSFYAYYRLLGLARSILDFGPPEMPYNTTMTYC